MYYFARLCWYYNDSFSKWHRKHISLYTRHYIILFIRMISVYALALCSLYFHVCKHRSRQGGGREKLSNHALV